MSIEPVTELRFGQLPDEAYVQKPRMSWLRIAAVAAEAAGRRDPDAAWCCVAKVGPRQGVSAALARRYGLEVATRTDPFSKQRTVWVRYIGPQPQPHAVDDDVDPADTAEVTGRPAWLDELDARFVSTVAPPAVPQQRIRASRPLVRCCGLPERQVA